MRFFVVVLLVFTLGAGWLGYSWLEHPLTSSPTPLDLSVEPGDSVREIANQVVRSGADTNASLLYWWFRLSGESRAIKAGSYEIEQSTTARSLLRKLVRGEESMKSVTLVEGWSLKQIRKALKNADQLRAQTTELSAEDIMQQLGRAGVSAEGRFFPDTYTYAKGASDLAILRRAANAMDKHLRQAWELRSDTSTLKSPDELLTMASIVEKETGRPSDRALISSVFNNRLRIGMRLQTDPSVIYGLGDSFDGNLRKIDLQTDTPWNTYTRGGLPPTPIAMPGKAALFAAAQPARSDALYFVARGDGSSQFSASLEAHNRAVNQYQRGQP